MSADLTE